MNTNLGYREVIPTNLSSEEWIEVKINTGTQITLQDIKTCEKAGGFCYKNQEHIGNRNRFIYWRTYQDVLELSEISLDISLIRNNLRLRFTDSALLSVTLTEQAHNVTILVVTVSGLHRFVFPFRVDPSSESRIAGDALTQSIFYDSNSSLNDPNKFHVFDGFGTMPHNLPQVANSYLSQLTSKAYFAVAYQAKIMLHIMDCETGHTISHEVKESSLMPRFFSNIKGALTGRTENAEAVISMSFSQIDNEVYLLTLYRNDELRLWSAETFQNICTINCWTHVGNNAAQGPQNNLLRKIDEYNFCVFLSHEKISEFVCVRIMDTTRETNARSLALVVMNSTAAPPMDLSDFDATQSHIWALWTNAEGDRNISTAFIGTSGKVNWMSAAMEQSVDRVAIVIDQGTDPREAYCSLIFHPGRFNCNVIAKALYMFRRANMRIDVNQLTMGILKEQVCQAMEDEIQNELKDFVVSDEQYLEIATRLWDRFYSSCEQYHVQYSEPIGLAVLPTLDAACVIRRQSFALLRPCEVLEHLMLIGEPTSDIYSLCASDDTTAIGFVNLMCYIEQLEKLLSDQLKMEVEQRLYQKQPPFEFIANLTSELIAADEDGSLFPANSISALVGSLHGMANLESAIAHLLQELSIEDDDDGLQLRLNYGKSTRFLTTGALLGSEYGISLLTETVKQTALIRLAVCRNLLILQFLLGHGTDSFYHPIVYKNIALLRSYYTLTWIAERPISLNAPANFEASIQRLSRAQLFSGYSRPYATTNTRLISHTTLLHLFLQSKGLYKALSLLFADTDSEQPVQLRQMIMQLVGYVNQMLWPDARNNVFPEWLFGTCQHIIVQDYVRILSGWCQPKSATRVFMLGVSLLDCGEPLKAVYLFEEALDGVLREPFLFEYVLKQTPLYEELRGVLDDGDDDYDNWAVSEEHKRAASVHYFLKIIQLFEQHSALDYVIVLAKMAMELLHPDDPELPMFQSIIFNNHLHLDHYEDAYRALISNADTSRRKDCLRQMVMKLFESKRYDLLMQFPYTGLKGEFENIVESRARSVSIEQNEVYDFLYAFHASSGNMRKAASVMYEQALRLRLDGNLKSTLDKRCSSLMICINALHLVEPRYQWIAKPTIGDELLIGPNAQDDYGDGDGDDDEVLLQQMEGADTTQIQVLEMADIRREFLHTEAMRELSRRYKDMGSYESVDAEQLTLLLSTCRLYTSALRLARGHSFSMLPIFESLTQTCVATTTEEKPETDWAWLQDNDFSDLPYKSNVTDMAWSLLQKLIVDNEMEDSTNIRHSVVNRLLDLKSFVPQWLYDSYKLANSRELLHLFVKHNRLLEACELACEMIGGMLGAGSEYFDFKHSASVTQPQLCFPINTIDLLLHGLKLNAKESIDYEMAHVRLEEEVARYLETVKRTTDKEIKLSILQERKQNQQQLQQQQQQHQQQHQLLPFR